jgi:hypothetical protein
MRFNRTLIVVGVVAGHMLLLNWLWTVVHQPQPGRLNRTNDQVARPNHAPTVVYLLAPPAPAAIELWREQAHQVAHSTRSDPKRHSAVPVSVQGDERSNAAALSNAALLPHAIGDSSAEVPKQAGSGLNLTLSREALKSLTPGLAASSPFQGRLPVTIEGKIAEAAATTGPWTEERLDNDRIRFRRGTTCVTFSRPEITKIDPFSESISRQPWNAAHPSECR